MKKTFKSSVGPKLELPIATFTTFLALPRPQRSAMEEAEWTPLADELASRVRAKSKTLFPLVPQRGTSRLLRTLQACRPAGAGAAAAEAGGNNELLQAISGLQAALQTQQAQQAQAQLPNLQAQLQMERPAAALTLFRPGTRLHTLLHVYHSYTIMQYFNPVEWTGYAREFASHVTF